MAEPAAPAKPAIDPVAFGIVRAALEAVTDEMLLSIMRTAHTSIIRDGMDFSVAVCTPDGDTAVQGFSVPLHLGAISEAVKHVLRRFEGDLHAGDLVIMNDPYTGGMHLPDVFLMKPCFAGERMIAVLVAVADFGDMGGRVPGGRPVDAKTVFEEGLRLPPLKFHERGREVTAIKQIIGQNVRLPATTLADLDSIVAALAAGERSFREVSERFRDDVVETFLREVRDYSEAIARSVIRALPDGRYEFTDYVDDSVIDDAQLPIRVALEIRDDAIHVDFDGTAAQVPASINATLSFTRSAVYAAVRRLLPLDAPNNDGLFRPIHVSAPAGTIVNPDEPAPVANRGLIGYRVVDAVSGALAQAAPDRVPAAGEGGGSSVRFSGTHRSDRFVVIDSIHGTWGARPTLDGIDGCANFAANSSNHPVEIIEADGPVRIWSYGLSRDSGGPGEHRGGLGLDREWELLVECEVTLRTDRTKSRPWGLAGGAPGRLSSTRVRYPDGTAAELPAKGQFVLPAGTRIHHAQASGGGFGNAFARDPLAVLRDWRDDKVTLEHARAAYGVAIDAGAADVDWGATKRLRGDA